MCVYANSQDPTLPSTFLRFLPYYLTVLVRFFFFFVKSFMKEPQLRKFFHKTGFIGKPMGNFLHLYGRAQPILGGSTLSQLVLKYCDILFVF